jgi:hypothetical protein
VVLRFVHALQLRAMVAAYQALYDTQLQARRGAARTAVREG